MLVSRLTRTRLAPAGLVTLLSMCGCPAFAAEPPVSRWGTYPASLDELLSKIPSRETNASAHDVEAIAERLGIDLVPRPVRGEKRLGTPAVAELQAVRASLGAYLDEVLRRESAGASPPPPEVARYLETHAEDLGALRERLSRDDPPRWERHLEKLPAMRLPNLLGHVEVHRVLIADAVARSAAGDDRTALADLEASVVLDTALWDGPTIIEQMIAIAAARMQAGALRHVAGAGPAWRERLVEHDFRDSLMDALQIQGFMWKMAEVPEGLEERRGLLQSATATLAKPYFRWCLDDTAEIWRRHLERIAVLPSLCGADLRALNETMLAEIPWWDRIARTELANVGEVTWRLARLQLDLELTGRVLALRSERDRTGSWPSVLESAESSACPTRRWVYEVGPDGGMSIGLDAAVDGPKSMTLTLPTRYVAAGEPVRR